jgi:hypothetical protein
MTFDDVEGSPATHVNGSGAGPYVFIGFDSPQIGSMNVILSAGNIKDSAGNQFDGSSWEYILVDPNQDNDKDGLQDGIEVDSLLTDPSDSDTDDDNIPDGFEISSTTCLDPLQNDAHIMDITGEIVSEKGLDSDDDGLTNIQEFLNNTDPCPPLQSMQEDLGDKGNSANDASIRIENISSMPFALVIREKSIVRDLDNTFLYDSSTGQAISLIDGNKINREISNSIESVAKRTLNISDFFDIDNFYPVTPNIRDEFIEYMVVATLNGKLHAVYWTDKSDGVPDSVKNLPYILSYILASDSDDDNKGSVF